MSSLGVCKSGCISFGDLVFGPPILATCIKEANAHRHTREHVHTHKNIHARGTLPGVVEWFLLLVTVWDAPSTHKKTSTRAGLFPAWLNGKVAHHAGKCPIPGKVRIQMKEQNFQVCQVTANDFKDPLDAMKVMNTIVKERSEGNVSNLNGDLYKLRDKILKEDTPKRAR